MDQKLNIKFIDVYLFDEQFIDTNDFKQQISSTFQEYYF